MSKGQVRFRLWMASLALGCLISLVLSAMLSGGRYGVWLPGVQPGWLLAWAVSFLLHDAHDLVWLGLITLGNTAFYTWFVMKVLAADLESRGRLSRILLS